MVPLSRTLRAVWVAMLLQVGAGSLVRERLVCRGNELGEVAGSRRVRVLAGIAAASGGGRGTPPAEQVRTLSGWNLSDS